MNRKGFTMIELLVVILIMAILTLIAIPSVTRLVNKGRNEQMISDAKELISKAKYRYEMTDGSYYFTLLNGQWYTRDGDEEEILGGLWSEDRYDGYGDIYKSIIITYSESNGWGAYLSTDYHCLSNSKDDNCINGNYVLEGDLDKAYVIERDEPYE